MPTRPFLMGAEVEYSMSGTQPRMRNNRTHFHKLLLDAVRAEHRWLPDAGSSTGIYIDNGSRYYLDSGKHNEFSSPEVTTPREIVIYDRAAEQILRQAKAAVKKGRQGTDICITKNNVNFSMPDVAAWGQHEAYTCWIPLNQAAPQLIPHLVSRSSYAGAGCLSAHEDGMGFELSQRARHMTRLTGEATTRDRAIFCTRAWKPSDTSQSGWTRTNLLSKDSQRCPFGMYLTYGVTGLLFMIMNEGHTIGRHVQLSDPVAAMRTFSLDPWLKTRVPLANGKQATAIDIQRAYLREAQPHVESGDYPDWTCEVMDEWSTTLDQLENSPLTLVPKLDAYLKLAMFDHQLQRADLSWPAVHQALQSLDQMRRIAPESIVRAVLNENPSSGKGKSKTLFDQLATSKEIKRVDSECLRFAVRLQALELNYHELGGLFDSLEAAKRIDVVVTPQEVQRAIHNPPKGGRAELRGKLIKDFHGQPWVCDWQYVANPAEEKWVDLRNPFTAKRRVTALNSSFTRRRRPSELSELLVRMTE